MKLSRLSRYVLAAALVLAIVASASAANTKAAIFVPHALAECAQIRQQIADLQAHAVALKSRYDALGGATMDGIDTFDFSNYGLTKLEFTDGMTDLSGAHNAIALSTILSGGGYNKVVKLGEGL